MLTIVTLWCILGVMDEQTAARFLARLWQCQSVAQLSGRALAKALGCDPSYIRLLKLGKRRNPSLEFVMAASRRFPELTGFLLPAEFTVSNNVVPTINDEVAG